MFAFLDRRLRWNKSIILIIFGNGLHVPIKMLEDLRAVGDRSAVTQYSVIYSMLEEYKGLSLHPMLGISLLLFRVTQQRDVWDVAASRVNSHSYY